MVPLPELCAEVPRLLWDPIYGKITSDTMHPDVRAWGWQGLRAQASAWGWDTGCLLRRRLWRGRTFGLNRRHCHCNRLLRSSRDSQHAKDLDNHLANGVFAVSGYHLENGCLTALDHSTQFLVRAVLATIEQNVFVSISVAFIHISCMHHTRCINSVVLYLESVCYVLGAL